MGITDQTPLVTVAVLWGLVIGAVALVYGAAKGITWLVRR